MWYVDGKEVGRYAKSTNQSQLNQGQWPFDKHFHLILNQSVGNNAWAADADVTHTYETRFDWVRVYQKNGMLNTNGLIKDRNGMELQRQKILKRGGKNSQKNCTKKIFMTQIITMV